ncbi:unnamed protein product [Protopolystoma xenopodis]|uniref:Uncharacterized protein n=1 Tax=Protopolystoma xenopodis TaxID=117903 RepID=A0A3S5CJQ4_9PLAT|nr:unnamed protein product [Protopolystoma xenopodis]
MQHRALLTHPFTSPSISQSLISISEFETPPCIGYSEDQIDSSTLVGRSMQDEIIQHGRVSWAAYTAFVLARGVWFTGITLFSYSTFLSFQVIILCLFEGFSKSLLHPKKHLNLVYFKFYN